MKSRVRKYHNCVYFWKILLTLMYICIILESIITGSYFFQSTPSQTALRRDFSYVMSSCLRCWFLLIVHCVAPGLIYGTLFKPGSRDLLISLCVFLWACHYTVQELHCSNIIYFHVPLWEERVFLFPFYGWMTEDGVKTYLLILGAYSETPMAWLICACIAPWVQWVLILLICSCKHSVFL